MRDRRYLLLPARIPFMFAGRADQPPEVRDKKVLTAGMDWMRIHFPGQWAAFCAARMHRNVDEQGRTLVTVTKRWWSGFGESEIDHGQSSG